MGNSQARCERGPGGRARVTIFARTESEVKQRPLIVLSLRRGEWRGVLAPALLSPRGSPWASRRTQAPLPAPLNHAPAARTRPPTSRDFRRGRSQSADQFCGYLARASGGGSTEMPLASAYRGTSPFAFEGRAPHKRALASKGHYQEGPGGRQDLSSHMHGALQSWALVARAATPTSRQSGMRDALIW